MYLAVPSLRNWLRYDFRASVAGKAATVVQFAAIAALTCMSPAASVFALASFVVGLIALADYLRRAVWLGQRRVRGAGDWAAHDTPL